MTTYYAKGVISFNDELNAKIQRDSVESWWYQDEYDKGNNFDRNFTGYVNSNGKVFDISHILSRRDEKKIAEAKKKRIEKFKNYQTSILKSTEEIENFCTQLDNLASAKGKARKLERTIKKGYVSDKNKIGGSKRKRRFKKDSRRFLTDQEIEKMKKDAEYYRSVETDLSKKIKIEDVLYKIIRRMYGISQNLMSRYVQAYGYHNAEGIYILYELRFKTMKERINGLAYQEILNERRMNRILKKKDSTEEEESSDEEDDSVEDEDKIKLKDIKVFEETYQKVMDKAEEDREAEEMMTVHRERAVTNRARHYIDENGNRVELSSNVRQVVLHN